MNEENRLEIEIAQEFGQELVDKLRNSQTKSIDIGKRAREPSICRYWESL
jgi:hypothetical protein